MSSEPRDRESFRCPVCRARQPLRSTCRRCRADLSLVERAHRRLEFLQRSCERAFAEDDPEKIGRLTEELRLLSPSVEMRER